MKILGFLTDKLNLKKGFRIHVEAKPKTTEEIMALVDEYQKDRGEEYRFFKKDEKLMMERKGITYKIEVVEAHVSLFAINPVGTIAGTWIVDVTKISD